MMKSLVFLFALMATAVTEPVLAGSIQFRVNGARVVNDSTLVVCTFPALSMDSPIEQFFFSNRLSCFPGATLVDGPLGLSNYFAEASGHVNALPGLLIDRRDPISAQKVLDIRVQLAPAAELQINQLALPPGSWMLAYCVAPENGGNHAILSRQPGRIMVPADTTVVPFIVRNSHPIDALEPIRLKPGTVGRPSPFGPNTRRVVTWMELPPRTPRRIPLPTLSLTVKGERYQQAYPPTSPRAAHQQLQLFSGRSAGAGTITLTGDYWQTTSIPVKVGDGLTVTPAPITALPASVLELLPPTSGQLTVESCTTPNRPCQKVAHRSVTRDQRVQIGGLSPAKVRVVLARGKTRLTWESVSLEPWKRSVLTADGKFEVKDIPAAPTTPKF